MCKPKRKTIAYTGESKDKCYFQSTLLMGYDNG